MENESRLVSGILKQAESDAEEIIRKAEKTIAEKNNAFDGNIERIQKETDKKISLKLSEIKKRSDSAVESERRKQKLRIREKVNSEVYALFTSQMKELVNTQGYREYLVKLIAEGAIAVNDEQAIVYCSANEEIDDDMLLSAEKLVKDKTGNMVKLSYTGDKKLSGQGVIVESSNGRIAYNNQVDTRLRRFNEDIKMIIINGLAKE